MSVLIRGMEMPKRQILAVINPNGLVEVLDGNTLIAEFEAVPVPPHGRLIDADALEHDFKKLVYQDNWYYNSLHHAPTIIPASEEGRVMDGCAYRTKDGECDLWENDRNHTPFCDPEHCDNIAPSNADRIRAMTEEELADWLGVYCNGQTAQEVGKPCVSGMGSCEECWLDWLKQEAKDNE